MVVYDGESSDTYLFTKNMHGDITRIVKANGTLIVSYTYDMHGDRTAIYNSNTSTPIGIIVRLGQVIISALNPFGYRSYCYDANTGLYYLQSRYYDPTTGRFINAESTDYLNVSGTVLGCNLFIYCENDPVNNVDPTGTLSMRLIKAAFNKVVAVLKGVITSLLNSVSSLFKRFINIVSYKKGVLRISANAASVVVDAIVSSLSKTSTTILKSFDKVVDYLPKNAKKSIANFVKKQVVPVLKNGFVNKTLTKIRKAIWTALQVVANRLVEYSFSFAFSTTAESLSYYFSILSWYEVLDVFSSWGSVFCYCLDVMDGSEDGYISITIKKRNN